MYKVVLHGTAWARDNGEYRQISADHRFTVEGANALADLIGQLAAATEDELNLTISWREETDD